MGKLKIFLIVFLVLLLVAGWYVSTGYYSAGERAGTISKFSERGYLFKTYEGQLMEGGYSGETGSLSPRYWDFSAKNDSVVLEIRKALSTGERVTLNYHEKFVVFPWNGDTKFIITDVVFLPKIEPLEPKTRFLTPEPETEDTAAHEADSVNLTI